MNGKQNTAKRAETRRPEKNRTFSFRFLMTVICIIAVIMVTVYFIGAQCRPEASDETGSGTETGTGGTSEQAEPQDEGGEEEALSAEAEVADEADDGEENVPVETEYSIYIPIDYNIPGQVLPGDGGADEFFPEGIFGLSDRGVDAADRTAGAFSSNLTGTGDGAVFVTHEHVWLPRTCTEPEICEICGVIGLPALGHDFGGATCKDPAVCERCGALGEKSDQHEWIKATCTEPKTCAVCGLTEGEPLGHKWKAATCQAPKTCSRCGEEVGEKAGHDWQDATCTKPKTCSVCGTTKGEALGHNWKDATCTKPKTCSRCGKESGDPLGHNWAPATKTSPSKCTVCGVTKGSRLPNPIKVSPFSYTEEEYDMLARIIYHEAGSKSWDAMMAVGAVVMNRVRSPKFGNTIKAVLTAPGQFVADLYKKDPPSVCYDAAKACLNGELYDSEVMYFRLASGDTKWSIRKYQFTVGDNYFYT